MLRADYRDMADDEKLVGRANKQGAIITFFCAAAPAIGGYFGGEKGGMYAAFVVVIYLLNEIATRLFDLSVRLSRTNELLVDGHDERRWRKET